MRLTEMMKMFGREFKYSDGLERDLEDVFRVVRGQGGLLMG